MNELIEKLYKETPNYVNTVYLGYKHINGLKTDKEAVIFLVEKKKPLSEVPTDEILPTSFKIGEKIIVTDVMEQNYNLKCLSNCYQAGDDSSDIYRTRILPVQGGISISDNDIFYDSAGTLGGLFKDNEDGTVVGLTNTHVALDDTTFAGEKDVDHSGYLKDIFEEVLQPATLDLGHAAIGRIKRFIPIKKTGINYIDALLVGIFDYEIVEQNISNKQLGESNVLPIASTAEIDSILMSPNPILEKIGRTTGNIGGDTCPIICVGLNFTTTVGDYKTQKNESYSAVFSDLIIYQYLNTDENGKVYGNVSVGGDSGSLLVANFNGIKKIVGLNFAAGTSNGGNPNDVGAACRIDRICAELNITYWDGSSSKLNNIDKYELITTSGITSKSSNTIINGKKYWQVGAVKSPIIQDNPKKFVWNICAYLNFDVKSLIYAAGKYVAVGTNGKCAVSEDNKFWITGNMPFINELQSHNVTWNSITYGQGKFVSISLYKGSGVGAYSYDGLNWIRFDIPGTTLNYSNGGYVVFGNNIFMASTQDKIAVSNNGINWTYLTQKANGYPLYFGNGYFIMTGSGSGGSYNPRALTYSNNNGANWNISNTSLPYGNISSLVYGNGKYIVFSNLLQCCYHVMASYSNDLVNWGSLNATTTYGDDLDGIATCSAYGNGNYVCLGTYNCCSVSNDDGVTWYGGESDFINEGPNYKCITYANGKFICASNHRESGKSLIKVADPIGYKLNTAWVNFSQTADILVPGQSSINRIKSGESDVSLVYFDDYLKYSIQNHANFNNNAVWNEVSGNVTSVGTNGGSSSYGTYDQNGNVKEWIETLFLDNSKHYITMGGCYSSNMIPGRAEYNTESIDVINNGDNETGFRIASYHNPYSLSNFVLVDDEGNLPDKDGFGGVKYSFYISKYEVTNNEYCEFLNSVASTDTHNLFNILSNDDPIAGISRSGNPGSYVYTVKPNMGNKPVVYISILSSIRYSNWLHNNKISTNSTESGAYYINESIPLRHFDSKYFLPNIDEWIKAGYYKSSGKSSNFWNYATRSDTVLECTANLTGDGIYI